MEVFGGITIKDALGVPRIILSADERAPRLTIVSADRSELVLESDSSQSRVRFRRSDGTDSALISASASGLAVVVSDRSGIALCIIQVDSELQIASVSAPDDSGRLHTMHECHLKPQ